MLALYSSTGFSRYPVTVPSRCSITPRSVWTSVWWVAIVRAASRARWYSSIGSGSRSVTTSPLTTTSVSSRPGTRRSAPAVPSRSLSHSQCTSSPAGIVFACVKYVWISSPRCPMHTSTRSAPWRTSHSKISSRIGRSPTGTSGFGSTVVYGRSRVPNPPASTAALIGAAPSRCVLVGAVAILVGREPLERPGEAGAQVDLGMPAGQRLGGAAVRQQARHFTGRGSQPLRVELDLERAPGELADQLGQLPDRDIAAAAELERPPDRLVARCDRHQSGRGVGDVGQVAARLEQAQPDPRAPKRPRGERGDGRTRGRRRAGG